MDTILISQEVEKFPSIFNALMANQEAVAILDKEEDLLKAQIEDTEKKINIAAEAKLPHQGLRTYLARLKTKIEKGKLQRKAYVSGYLEIPRLQRRPDTLEFKGSRYWGFRLNKNTPLRVFEAVKKAGEAKLFDRLVVFREGGDPVIAGEIGDRYFYLTSWR